ncbi:MAG: NAD-dependent succinate-semialdehyde dehydrogenase [Bacteroidales bacterium]|nr:NAD-dependent succinate-semialdehyde dehydrogenase [Bacteroidales bacterium]
MLQSINPVCGSIIAEYAEHSMEASALIIGKCAKAQKLWEHTDFAVRKSVMKLVADLLRTNTEEYAKMITLEMGKPIVQSRAEVLKCASVCDYYADHAEAFLSNESVSTDASESYIAYRPLGVVLAVMPWNFPFWQVFRFAAPALMSGNGVLLKHASNVTGSALLIEKVFRDAGFPDHLFRTLKVPGKNVGQLIENPLVKAVTLTGSVPAGRAVAAKAGQMLKKTVLELGGSDPYIILEDADLDTAAELCVNSRLINSGQSCIAAKRFIAVRPVYEAFVELFIQKMQKKSMGDPVLEEIDVGPQASVSLRDELHEQVLRSIEKGARCELGGKIPDQKGAWYPPTVLTDVTPGMPAFDEELFGPVAAIIEAKDEADAVRLANNTVFGLGAAVFTGDGNRGKRIAEMELRAGCCFVNDMVKSDPRLPFGGIGDSGYGRELSCVGIREFTNIKTVVIR